jgi:hypothetical protein
MRVHRISSVLTISTAILTACLLIAASLETAPSRSSSVQAAHQNTGPSRPSTPQPPSGYPTPLAEQRMAGGYWRIDHTFQPTLIITNVLQNIELPVTPVVYAADGTEYQLSPVTLAPAGVSSIDIRSAIAVAPDQIRDHFTEYGSAAVKYVWHWSGAASAQVDNRDAKRSLNFGFELRSPMMTIAKMAANHRAAATVQEGLWWREDSGVKGFLALINVAARPVNAQVQVLSNYGAFESERTLRLQANETRNLDLLDDTEGSSGGIRVTYNGAASDVVVAGGLENPHEGYSAQIPFVAAPSEPNSKPSNVSYSSVGLMLGAPDPMMKFPASTQFGVYLALRNTTPRPVLVDPTLYYMQGSDVVKAPLNRLILAAREARHWTPEEFAAELGLSNFSGMINLVLSYQGSPRDVIMASGSIDQTKTYVFEIKMEGVGKSLGKGLKDWDVSNGNDTMISLINLDEKDQDFWVTLFFDGAQYKVPVHLKAGGSTMFNVSETIMMQQPDSDGHKIPPGTLHGTAVLSAASPDPQWVNVGVSIGIFNVSTATCGGHCPNCTTANGFRVQADRGTALVGQDAQFSSWALFNASWVDYTLQSSWSSSNIQVAQPSGSTVGAFTGVSPGSFSAQAFATLEAGSDTCPESCATQGWGADAPGTITPNGFGISVTSTPIQGETNSIVSGQSAQVQVTVQGANGATATYYTGSVHFSSTDSGASLPSDYSYTASDAGVHTFNVTLKSVSGNSATRDLSVQDSGSGVSSTQNINVWFQVIATREGLVGGLTACGHTITTNDHFVALPATGLCNLGVRLRNGTNLATTTVLDVGPWCPNTPGSGNSNTCSCPSDRYWQTTGVPFAATASCATSHAGIDLADGTFADLGLTNNGNIYWRFQ